MSSRVARKKVVKASGSGGFVLTFEPGRCEWLLGRMRPEERLSESFSSADWELDQRELMFLSLNVDPLFIHGFVLMEKLRASGGFAKKKMRMTQMVVFDVPIQASRLEVSGVEQLVSTPEKMRRLDVPTWLHLVESVKKARPGDASAIDDLVASRDREQRLLGGSNKLDRLNEQRDGIGLSLDIAGIGREQVFRTVQADRAGTANSILDVLDAFPVQERSMIEHDARLFEELLGAEPDRIAFLGEHVDRSVRVLVTDKTNLETVLGVDLIAYNVLYDSFILLQYKKMSQVGDGWHYPVPPTSNLREQLDKMASFRVSAEASGNSAQPTLWTYRLSDNPFYFKFCEQFKPTAQDASLMPGITLSSVHLAEFLTLPEAQGDQGGLGIGYRNCPRYFNNTEFVQLARAGWIGAGRQSVALLKEVLAAGVKGGRNAMLTVIETPKDSSASARNWRS